MSVIPIVPTWTHTYPTNPSSFNFDAQPKRQPHNKLFYSAIQRVGLASKSGMERVRMLGVPRTPVAV